MAPLQTTSVPHCYLCGSQGTSLHTDLIDHLFGVEGDWQLKICENAACQLVWLDPMPTLGDLPKAYQNYYTHQGVDTAATQSLLHTVDFFAYQRFCKLFFKLTGMQKQRIQKNFLFLQKETPGRLLDVGCGAGHLLNRIRQLGWEVEGIDFDENAVEQAKKLYQLKAQTGDLKTIAYPNNSFDVITLKHVIEHIPEPVELLQECYRILKTGGRLIMTTPNIQSWGHQRFQHYWRGLEPPRHLFLYNCHTLAEITKKAGFTQIDTRTTSASAEYTFARSMDIQRKCIGKKLNQLRFFSRTWLWEYYEHWLLKRHPNLGEEIILIAKK